MAMFGLSSSSVGATDWLDDAVADNAIGSVDTLSSKTALHVPGDRLDAGDQECAMVGTPFTIDFTPTLAAAPKP